MGNTNLTSGQVLPGFWGFVDYNSQGSAQAPNNRVLLWGYKTSTGTRTPNRPFLPASQQEVDDGCGVNSDLRGLYASTLSQPEAQGAEVWVLPIAENSGGVQSTYTLTVYGTPTKSGTLQLWIDSVAIPAVGFTTADTPTTIAAALAANISSMTNLPFASVTPSSGVITLTYQHKGTTGEDLPMRCSITPNGSGVNLSPGQALFATAATGAGSVVVSVGGVTVTTAIANSDTAAQIATKVAASWNADTYPLTAVVDGSTPAQVDFYFNPGWDVRRMTASVVTTTGTTVNLGSGATNGAGSPSSTTNNGTLGTGLPSLTAALSNLGSLPAFRAWVSPWIDTASLSSMATNIDNSSDGSIIGQKQQTLTFADWEQASVFGAVLSGTTPNMNTAKPQYAALWSPDVPVQAPKLAGRVAAARAALWFDQPQKNWNGFQVKGNEQAPILLPPSSPSLTQQNTALRTYALAPVVVGPSGNLEVVKGRTTSLATDKRLWAWSCEAQAAYHETDSAIFLQQRFSGGSIVRFSTPKAPKLFDAQSFIDAMQERMRLWETQGNYDGADALKGQVKAKPNRVNIFRMDVDYPESPVLDLDQVVFVSHFTNPSS